MSISRTELLERAELADWPGVVVGGSRYLHNKQTWRAAVESLPSGYFDELTAALEKAEAQAGEREARELRDDAEDAERNRPLYDETAPEVIAARQDAEEADMVANAASQPATRKQLAELISLQRDILDELRSRRSER